MEVLKFENFSFSYPNGAKKALANINLTIEAGDFVVVCGASGCGKTTLLRCLKPMLSPHGAREGQILFDGENIAALSHREESEKIGFVLQNPDAQIVTDKVWHELAFGLENLGIPSLEIQARVAEMASFFGIQRWFHQSVEELSGGQKQLLNLASVMVMQPQILILDEPTAQLDPIAAEEFLQVLEKINRETGTTIVLSEHRLEESIPLANKMVVLEEGRLVASGTPCEVGASLRKQNHIMAKSLPTAMRVYGAVEQANEFPVSVCQGRAWLSSYVAQHAVQKTGAPSLKTQEASLPVLTLSDVYYRYTGKQQDILRGLSLQIPRGTLYGLLGGNGVGKTTLLSLICGSRRIKRGKIKTDCKRIRLLPQNPQTLFVQKTVELDLKEMQKDLALSDKEKADKLRQVITLCRLEMLLERHPYDLSGGEQQRAALAKVLLTSPDLLLLDEPTKGMDADFKQEFAQILHALTAGGTTILMVSHDVEFCARYADLCGLMFDGAIVHGGAPRTFFAGKRFYATAATRMARGILEDVLLAEDIVARCGTYTKTERNEQ